jgi:hypothetical protein
MDMVSKNLPMGILTEEIIKVVNLMATVSITGITVAFLKVNLNQACAMGKVYGQRVKLKETPMKGTIRTIKNVAMAFLSGAQAIPIRASSSMI